MKLSLSKIQFLLSILLISNVAIAEEGKAKEVTVGVASVLTGDLSVLGQNIVKTVETYKKHYLRHKLVFEYEDARKSGVDGLNAYQSLINQKKSRVLIGGTVSNGTLAAADFINRSRTVMVTPLTGGSNIDNSGEYIFRIGNSDILNGYQQAQLLIDRNINSVALVTEETEYTQDIAKYFRQRFVELGGRIVYDENFLPDQTDFRTQIAQIRSKKPQALFMSTQTGLAFGLFIKQLREQKADQTLEVHTNFLAASNPDAFAAAGDAIYGVYYMAPSYDAENPALKKFFAQYLADHKTEPAIAFHSAGTVDALNMLQDYLDTVEKFDSEEFRQYLLNKVKNYPGLMGTYSFDENGNADIGFSPEKIENL